MAIAAFINYNKASFVEKYRTRKGVENRIEEITGIDMNLKNFFKGVEGLNRDLEDWEEDSLTDLKTRLEGLSEEEKDKLMELLEEKGDEAESFLTDMMEGES